MARTAKTSNPQRLETLRTRVVQPDYLDNAITTIASMLSTQILQERDAKNTRLAKGISDSEHRIDPNGPTT